MAIKVLHTGDVGQTLHVVANKLEVKPDNSGNVKFEATAAGLKAQVELPAVPETPAALNGATISGNTLTFTQTKGTPVQVELPAVPVDVKLQSLSFTGDGKLQATLSDGSSTEVAFTAAVVIGAIKSANAARKEELVTALLPQLKQALRGQEHQDFAGNTTGYLLKAD